MPLNPLSTSSKISVRSLSLFADNDLIIRTTVSSGAPTVTIGTMPNAGSTTYFASRVTVHVATGFSGDSVDHITIGDGSLTMVANADADITTAGSYVIDLPFATATAGGATISLAFLKSNASASTPTGGSAGGNLNTDSAGSVSGTFAIPNPNVDSNPRWRTGKRVFR